ncbi:substrate-binding domain-containing protein [Pseudogracilibacillus sp. SE30717A]|uniref:sugar ABC transporter substrate-binding protein n=1 Tax=Pseudogracilibacillus sp. SE30717A TaxID=3098293 RepID=UPI00300DC1C8
MEKIIRSFSPVLLAMVLILLSACGSADSTDANTDSNEKESNDKKIKIGVAMKTEVQPRWKFEVGVMEELANEHNAEIIVQWANDDVTKQGNQIENLLSQGIDALIVVPVTDKIGPFIQSAKNEGIPVVSYDAIPVEADIDLFVTRDNYKVGEIQSEYALDYTDGKGNFVVLKGDPATTVAQGIAEAYEELLVPNTDINIVADQWHQNWSTEEALKTAENALSAQEDNIQAFVSSSDGIAMGVAQAVKGRGLDGKVFISGLDVELGSAKLIAEGTQTMSVWTMIDDQAEKALLGAISLIKGEEIDADGSVDNGLKEVPAIYSDVIAVDQSNLCEFIDEIAPEGWVTAEEVFEGLTIPSECQ